MAKENCGCDVQFFPDVRTIYCPVHSAAFEMREALKTILGLTSRGIIGVAISRCAKEALSLAEGKEAPDAKPET